MKIATLAIRLESFGVPLAQAVVLAGQTGAAAITFDAVGELAPHRLSQTGRREIRHLLSSRGLRLAAIGFPTRFGYDDVTRLDDRRQGTCAALKFAFELGAPLVINQLGKVPDSLETVPAQAMIDALRRIAEEGDRVGAHLSVRAGSQAPEKLSDFLKAISPYGLFVHLEPAALMVNGHPPADAARMLLDRVGSVQAKDAMRSLQHAAGFRELPVGRGEVDWKELRATLAEIDFRGPVIIEQEVGELDQRVEQITAAVRTLTQ